MNSRVYIANDKSLHTHTHTHTYIYIERETEGERERERERCNSDDYIDKKLFPSAANAVSMLS